MINANILMPGSKAWLMQAVTISLYTNARAADSDVLPDTKNNDKQGCWDDVFLPKGQQRGSRLWLLARSTINQQTLNTVQDMLHECLDWLLVDYLKKLDITVTRLGSAAVQFNLVLWISDSEKFTMEIPYAF
jgi:phage gp46-like protein